MRPFDQLAAFEACAGPDEDDDRPFVEPRNWPSAGTKSPDDRPCRSNSGSTSVTFSVLRPHGGKIAEENLIRSPVSRSIRLSLTRGALTSTAPALISADPDHDAELVRSFLGITDPETGRPLSDAAIRADLIGFLFAGHDTTATTIAYSLWALGHHPEMQQRVADEVASLGDVLLTTAHVPHLGYTVRVLHEAMRLCPPAAGVGRLATRDVEIDGYRVPTGSHVVVAIIAIHRDPALWDDALSFDPDRFSPERAAGRDRWQFVPSAVAHDPAWAITSRCSKRRSVWPALSERPDSSRSTPTSPSHSRSR